MKNKTKILIGTALGLRTACAHPCYFNKKAVFLTAVPLFAHKRNSPVRDSRLIIDDNFLTVECDARVLNVMHTWFFASILNSEEENISLRNSSDV